MCVLSHFSHIRLFVIRWTVARQAPLSWSSQDKSGLLCPSPRDLPHPGIEPAAPALQVDSLSVSHQGGHSTYDCVQNAEIPRQLDRIEILICM